MRLHRTEAFLKTLFPSLDISAPDFDPTKLLPHVEAAARQLQGLSQGAPAGSSSNAPGTDNQSSEAPLESMVQAAGRLDIDETGHMDFHGHSSGMTYLNHLNSQFGNILGEVKISIPPPGKPAVDSPASSIQSPGENLPDTSLLPTQEVALTLVETCMDCACVLMRFIHKPSFMSVMERIFRKDPDTWDEEENRFLPLLYLALGVGCLFVDSKKLGIENITAEAYGNQPIPNVSTLCTETLQNEIFQCWTPHDRNDRHRRYGVFAGCHPHDYLPPILRPHADLLFLRCYRPLRCC